MRIAPAQHRAYSYTVTSGPDALAVTLDNVKLQLKITNSVDDDLLTIFIEAATDYAEKFTRRDFITKTYTTFRDAFPSVSEGYYQFGDLPQSGTVASFGGNIGFEIRKSPLQSIETIKYRLSDVLTTVDDTTYYNTVETDYSEVLTKADNEWPLDADVRLQTVEISFKAGFGDADTDMPDWVATGIMNHVAELYANRGDCSCEGFVESNLPPTSKILYSQNRILNL